MNRHTTTEIGSKKIQYLSCILLVILFIFRYDDTFRVRYSHNIKKRKLVTKHVSSKPNQRVIQNHLLPKSKQLRNGQRIVILAGPHKTASSSIQNNLYTWTSTDPQLLPSWSWPVPDEVLELCDEHDKYNTDNSRVRIRAKGFYPLAEAININARGPRSRPLFSIYNKSEVLGFYRDAIKKEWRDGHNVIIGTEGLDFLVLRNGTSFENFLSVLPLKEDRNENAGVDSWGVEIEDVTVVVKFRAPRVQHLISVWHQCCAKKITLMQFLNIVDSSKMESKLHILASFELSEIFLKHGFHVVLIDMGGISHGGYDISNIIACDIMNANCTKEKEIVSVSDEENGNVLPNVKNVKHDKGDMGGVTDYQLDEIEKVLRRYDCNHQHVLKHENLTVLYNYDVDPIIGECAKMKEIDLILSRHVLAKKIKSVVNNTGDFDGWYYGSTDIGNE